VSGPGGCQVCGLKPAAMLGVGFCFDCWPGGPVPAPPCRACRSTTGYYTSGLCERCHPRGPASRQLDSCGDCLAWGATRTTKWRCKTCADHWRKRYPTAVCPSCHCIVPVHPDGGCRLCRRQRTLVMRDDPKATLLEANRYGQQLYFVDMFHGSRRIARPVSTAAGDAASRRTKTPAAAIRRDVVVAGLERYSVRWAQEVLFDWPRDMAAGVRRGFPPPPDPALAAILEHLADDRARRYGWSRTLTEKTRRGLRILLGMQDTPGAPVPASDVALLAVLKISVPRVREVLADAGLLDDDLTPAIVRWFPGYIADLPEAIRGELTVWFEVMHNGSTVTPRRTPRADTTTANNLRWALPAIRAWAADGHQSLREITRDDILAGLPASGSPRSCMLQGLRSIFRILKGRQLAFVNPTVRIHIPAGDRRQVPPTVDLTALRAALDSEDVTRAALAALLAYHAIRVHEVGALHLTDVRDGRLHVGDQVIPLADPVRLRLSAYLTYRAEQFPATANPHLFVHARNVQGIRPVTPWWIRHKLGMSAQAVRQDRILDEAHASGGDVRLVCDLFGLSIAGAYRYTNTVGRPDADYANAGS